MNTTIRWGLIRRVLRTALVTLAVAGVGYYFYLWLPVGAGPVGVKVSREPFTKTWTDQSVVLLGLGDSVTAGFGARRGYDYFSRLAQNPSDEWLDMQGICLKSVFPHFTARNQAVSGSTSFEHLRQVSRLAVYPTNVLGIVVMTTGGNDIIHDYGRSAPREGAMFGASWEQAQPWIKSFDQRLEEILQHLQRAFPGGCHIFLATIYDPSDMTGTAMAVGLPRWKDGLRIHAAYNEVITRFAARHSDVVHLVDIRTPLLGHGLTCRQFWREHYRADDPHYWYLSNFEDPNERGYDALRRLFLNEIARVFAPK